ncbi:hypothetical protein OQA88_13419 [Cercophora sp. LCS_1]
MTVTSLLVQLGLAVVAILAVRFIYNLYFHPLAKYPGPWYLAISSLPLACIAILIDETEYILRLIKKHGDGDKPIRDPKHNTKAGLYESGMLGPVNIFTTIDGNEHKAMRKALGGPQWSFGALKNIWEPRIDALINLFISKMTEFESHGESVVLCDKVAQFAADVMAMVCFGEVWGFVESSRDQRGFPGSFREGLVLFGFVGRWRGFRETVIKSPLAKYLVPKTGDERGMGFLVSQAGKLVTERERRIEEEGFT